MEAKYKSTGNKNLGIPFAMFLDQEDLLFLHISFMPSCFHLFIILRTGLIQKAFLSLSLAFSRGIAGESEHKEVTSEGKGR